MGDGTGHREELRRTSSSETSTLDTKEGASRKPLPLRTEAAWDGFEDSLTCVTHPSLRAALRQTVPVVKRRWFPPGPGMANMKGTLSEFLPSLSLRAVSVKVGMWMTWGTRCQIPALGKEGVTSR